ncbi:polyphosphate kinase 2 family protein [Candidatus Peribacteria bacterium]|nr:polyphosphate kinase 2 family protein [Candidatus Peribacteria bacterium]
MTKHRHVDLSDFRIKPGENIHMKKIDTDATFGWDEESAMKRLEKNRKKIIELQDMLYAEHKQSLLVVLQAMDAAGKDSTIKYVTQGINPQGCSVVSFKQPSSAELAHDFLWRIHQAVPEKGKIGIFNRSHYEDVIITRVHELVDRELIKKRYDHINDFERMLTDHSVKIVKIMLHISSDYQLKRIKHRLEKPEKAWKFQASDLAERKHWDDYMDAFEKAIEHTSTSDCPWFIVPGENKWFRYLVVSEIILQALEDMAPELPKPNFDIKIAMNPEFLK